MTEYKFFLTYFKTRAALYTNNEALRNKWLKILNKQYDEMSKKGPHTLDDMKEVVYSQCQAMIPY